MSFISGHIERRYIEVPYGATWAEATMRTSGFDTTRRFYIDTLQLFPLRRPIKWESASTFASPSTKSFTFPVFSGQTMELAIAQFWSTGLGSREPTIVDFELLEKLKQLILFIERKVGEVRLNLHSEPDGPVTGNGALKSSLLMPGYSFASLTRLNLWGYHNNCDRLLGFDYNTKLIYHYSVLLENCIGKVVNMFAILWIVCPPQYIFRAFCKREIGRWRRGRDKINRDG